MRSARTLLFFALSLNYALAERAQVCYFKYFLAILPMDWKIEEPLDATADAEGGYHLLLLANDHSGALSFSLARHGGKPAPRIAQELAHEFGGSFPQRNGLYWEFTCTRNTQNVLCRVSATDAHCLIIMMMGDIVACAAILNTVHGITPLGIALLGR